MPERPEYRVGDLAPEFAGRPEASPPAAAPDGVDVEVFPTLAAFLRGPVADFRQRLDALAARARQESSPEVQAALQTAVRLLPEVFAKHGG